MVLDKLNLCMQGENKNDLLDFLDQLPALSTAMTAIQMHWWYWDVQQKKLTLNPELVKLLGYTEEEFDSSIPTLDKNIHPDDSSENLEKFTKFIQGDSDIYEMEYRVKVRGKWCWYYNRGAVISRNEDNSPRIAGGITLNISDRYSRLLGKVEEGANFEFVFNNTSEAVLIVSISESGKKGIIQQVNQAAADLFACKPGDLVGMDPYDLLAPHMKEAGKKLRESLLKHGKLKTDVKSKDFKGRDKYLKVHAHLFLNPDQNLFIAIVSDKTESRRIQKDLEASELALKQSEKIYRSLIQAADDRIGLFNSKGEPVLLNNAFFESLGFSYEEYMALENRERIHPEDLLRMKKLRKSWDESGYTSAEYRVEHKDGHYLHMNSKSVLLKDSQLETDYILFIIRDVTERVAFQKELLKAKERAEESDQLKSAFLANMSHEIRTPMNSIVGFSNLLTEEDLDEPSRKEYVNRINRNSEQLLALISDIIDLAKIESNQLSVSYRKVIIENLFCELTNYAVTQLEQRGKQKVLVENDLDEGALDLEIESDLVRLTQIMQNLINNAVKFTSKGKIIIGYRLVDNDRICLFVKDTGPGIERKNFELIFDQFRQVDGSNIRKYGGTGLGLAICKQLSALLKGKIWVESEPGKGASFYLELPLKSGFELSEKDTDLPEESRINKKISILVVDDDHDSLMLLLTMLRSEGIQVLTADNGYQALELLQRQSIPDLVVMDLQMPVLDGIETFKLMRERYPGLRVIAHSADLLREERERILSIGFTGYLSKPFSKQELLNTIFKLVSE